MKAARASFPTLAILISLAGVVGVHLVRVGIFAPATENVVRAAAGYLGLFLVPFLVAFAFCTWTRTIRPALPGWRNGLALSSLLILSAMWVAYTVLWGFVHLHLAWGPDYDPTWMGIHIGCTYTACILALALRGSARAMAISAALCLSAGMQSMIHSGTMRQLLKVLPQLGAR